MLNEFRLAGLAEREAVNGEGFEQFGQLGVIGKVE